MDEYDVDGTMRKLFGNEIDCLMNDKFIGSNEESKISVETLNIDNMYDKIAPEENNASTYNQKVPSRIVETSGNDIMSHQCSTNVTLYSKDVHDGKYQNKHELETVKIDHTSLKDIRKALDDRRAQELGSKRKLDIHYFLNRMRTHAFHLFIDVGWSVERIKIKRLKYRPDNTPMYKLVQSFICISPKGHVHRLLSGAWVACGEELHSKLSNPNCDEVGKMWFNKNDFYLDMVYTSAFIEKEEKKLSLLIRWQLLDPFIAAAVIDKKVSALGKIGLALKAINSKTYIVETNSDGNHEKIKDDQSVRCHESIKENSNASSLQHQKENSLANSTEKECHGYEIGTSTQENYSKEREIEHSMENDSFNKELTIRGNNVKRILNLKPGNTAVEIQTESSDDMIQQNAMTSRDACNLCVMNQTHVYSKKQQQSVYLYHSQGTPYFYGTHDINSLMNMQQALQPFLYHVVPGKSMQQAMQTCIYSPMIQGIDKQKLMQNFPYQPSNDESTTFYDAMNSNEASCSKKLKKHKQKRSKKLSEIKSTEEIFSEHNASDGNINQVEFINPQGKIIKSKKSENEESFEKSDGKAWRMVVEDSLCFVEDDPSLNKTNKRHTESETKPFKRNNKSKKNRLRKEEYDTPLMSNVIKSKSCEINDDDILISTMRKSKDPLKYYRKRKNRSKNSNKPSLRRREECDTKKPRTVLCWLIEKGVVSENQVIQSVNSFNNALQKEGVLRRNGIICNCCNNLFSVSSFRIHASREKKYYSNLFVGHNKTYTLCQLEAWSAEYRKRKNSTKSLRNKYEDHNDDVCALCGDGGDLVCCDGCPSSYHRLCLPSEELPEGSWYCHHCTCSVCGYTIKEVEPSTSPNTLICQQCEQKYHQTCIGGKVLLKEEVELNSWFCGDSCKEVCVALRSHIGEMTSVGDGFYYTILRCNHGEEKFSTPQKITSAAECHTKLAVALDVVEECFIPWVDSRTGIHVIPHILYNWGSNYARLNYQGFYTVALEREDETICVASIRVHGVSVAEIPLISTCNEYRRQGMCRRLMVAIEQLLKSLKVELLVLSSVPELVDTWMSGFGYKHMESNEKRRLINVNLMSIPGTVMLQKSLYEGNQDSVESNERVAIETTLKENDALLLGTSEMNQLQLGISLFENSNSSEMKQLHSTEQNIVANTLAIDDELSSQISMKTNYVNHEDFKGTVSRDSTQDHTMYQFCSTETTMVEVLEVANSFDKRKLQ